MDVNEKSVQYPESDVTRRIKNERINRGHKDYRGYLDEAYGKGRAKRMLSKAAN